MTTQYERAEAADYARARKILALLEAATAAIPGIEDPDLALDLRRAVDSHNIDGYRQTVAYYERRTQVREREATDKGARLAKFEELPVAPADTQCAREVGVNQGRWTDFHRCRFAAKRVVTDATGLHAVCTIHAKEFLATGIAAPGWSKEPQHTDWPWRKK